MSLLNVRNLVVGTADNIPLLKNLTLDIQKEKITAFIGESGSGKTILSKTLSGLLPETVSFKQGEFVYNGRAVDYEHLIKRRGSHIFYAPQNAAASLNPVVKIKKQIMEASRMNIDQVTGVLKELEFPDPAAVLNAYPFELSGGENQRCLLAMAIAIKPQLLILDEPTAALDYDLQESFMALLKRIHGQHNLTLLLITHNLFFAVAAADYIYVILDGEIVDRGTPAFLSFSSTHPYTKELEALGGPGTLSRKGSWSPKA